MRTATDVTTLASIPTLEPQALHALALDAVPRGLLAHWSLLALTLWRIEELGAYREYGAYASTRAFATEELHLPPDEARVLVDRLYPAMLKAHADGVPLEAWAAVPKSRAVALVKVLALGGDARRWVEAAAQVTSTAAFTASIREALGEEPWTEFKVRVPSGLMPLLERAMELALIPVLELPASALVEKASVPVERIHDPELAFLLLEDIAREYVALRSTYA